MARLARVVVPEVPYHVTHRGNRRGSVFVCEDDRDGYLALLAKYAGEHGLELESWCLMTNHVHLLVYPHAANSLALTLGNAHGKYAQWFNGRHGLSGHLWANRFYSAPLDAEHLWACVRYIELNPVRASLVERAELWPWSSARAHCLGAGDGLLSASRPFPGEIADWSAWLREGVEERHVEALRANTLRGRPCGNVAFVDSLEERLNRLLRPQKRGRKACISPSREDDLFGS